MNFAVKLGIEVMEVLFAVGIIGSAVVILLTTVEDSEVFLPVKEPEAETQPEAPAE